jgi:predicted dinucleotide-binding enzyme
MTVKIAVMGTGMVGRAIAVRLAQLGHDVVIGTRDPQQTLARTSPEDSRTECYAEWQRGQPSMRLVSLPEAGAHGELVVNATLGASSLEAFQSVGSTKLAGKIILDLALPLDRSGTSPRLLFALTDSLGEQIQRSFPEARVVKTLCTVSAKVMIEPGRVPGRHSMFVAGDDKGAKQAVTQLLTELGWPAQEVIDVGGIEAARGLEMYAPLLFALAGALGTWDLNIAVVRAAA